MINLCLMSAMSAIATQDYDMALSYLSECRMYARQGDTIKCKVIAVQCTAAMQALFPLELERVL